MNLELRLSRKTSSTDQAGSPCRHLCNILQDSSRRTSGVSDMARSSPPSLVLLKDDDGFEHHLCLDENLETEPDLITLNNALKLSN